MARNEQVGGWHAVRHLLQQAPERVLHVRLQSGREDRRATEVAALADVAGASIRTVAREELDRLAGELRHQGVLAEVRGLAALDDNGLYRLLDQLEKPPFLLVLDGVQDPRNLGACLRLADGAGVDCVIVPRKRAATLSPAAVKVASGAAATMPLARVTNLARCLRELQQRGVRIIGTAADAPSTLYQADLSGPLALVLGGEQNGLRRLTRECCDDLVRLPLHGGVESLNVAVTAGICVFEALRRRDPGE